MIERHCNDTTEVPLTADEIKRRLGYGAGARIARQLGVTRGHVAQVLRGERADRRVAVAVARRLQVPLARLPASYYVRAA